MMKNVLKTRKLLQILFLLCVLTLLPTLGAEAAKKPVCAKKQTVYFYNTGSKGDLDIGCDPEFTTITKYIYIKNLASKATITNIKSSNKKVKAFSCYKASGNNLKAISLTSAIKDTVIKSGEKTKITFTVKQGGTSYKLSCTVTFKIKPSPVKTFKVGSENNASFFKDNEGEFFVAKLESSKAKVSIKAASGYKITAIYAKYEGKAAKKIKSGATISTKNLTKISVTYCMKKKPTYYQKPIKWTGSEKSPLYETISLCFEDEEEMGGMD